MFKLLKLWRLILASTIALVIFGQTGIIAAWPSPILGRLISNNSAITVTSNEKSWIATIMLLAAVITIPISSTFMQFFGPKRTILIAIIPIIISWIIISLATTSTHLIIARVFSGIGVSYAYSSIPTYLAEISPDSIRGALGVCITIVANIGFLWIYWIGFYFDLWISSLVSASFLLITIFFKFLPESPYFLIQKDQKEEAIKILQMLRNKINVDYDIQIIENTLHSHTTKSSFKELLTETCHRRALFICLGTITSAQFSGSAVFALYTHLILQQVHDVDANLMSLIRAIFLIVTSIVTACVIENIGKKLLLILSCIGCSVFMACEGIYFYLEYNMYNVNYISWLPLVSIILFDISFMIGLGPITLSFIGELFHPKIKIFAVGISTGYFLLTIFIIGILFPIMVDALGSYIPFFIFSAMGLLSIIFVIFYVPETRGKSLDDVQYYMEHKKFRKTTDF